MYKHILVPTDGSGLSTEAVRKAVVLAREMDAKITFVCVQPDFELPVVGEGSLIPTDTKEVFLRQGREEAERILRGASDLAAEASVPSDSVTLVSDFPYNAIIDTANSNNCDLIFMASHGRRGLAGLLIGSETLKVLTHCKIPVLVYR